MQKLTTVFAAAILALFILLQCLDVTAMKIRQKDQRRRQKEKGGTAALSPPSTPRRVKSGKRRHNTTRTRIDQTNKLVVKKKHRDVFDLEDAGRNFRCPEKNGLFPDPEQCDLFYECVDEVASANYCEDGLLFDYSQVNHERCKLPSEMAAIGSDCGDRIYVQEPAEDIVDVDKCPHSNGFFNHPDPTVCDKFIRCDKGRAFELGCAPPLIFDVKIGSCAFEDQVSAYARICSQLEKAGEFIVPLLV